MRSVKIARVLVVLLPCVLLFVSCSMSMKKGQDWLNTKNDPPAVNVTGTWTCQEFSVAQLKQDGRDITGAFYGGGLIKGVASGDSIHLLVYDTDTVLYMASLKAVDPKTLKGEYTQAYGHPDDQAQSIRRPIGMVKLPPQ